MASHSGQTTLRWSEPPEGSSTANGRAHGWQRPTNRAVGVVLAISRCGAMPTKRTAGRTGPRRALPGSLI